MREPQMAKEAFMQGVRMLTSTGEPGGDRRLTVAEDPLGSGSVQPFCQRCQHDRDLPRRSFQTVERRVPSSTERGAARLAAKGLDRLSTAMLAVPDKRMEVSVCVAKVQALRVRTGEALGVYAFRGSPPAFHLTPGTHWRGH